MMKKVRVRKSIYDITEFRRKSKKTAGSGIQSIKRPDLHEEFLSREIKNPIRPLEKSTLNLLTALNELEGIEVVELSTKKSGSSKHAKKLDSQKVLERGWRFQPHKEKQSIERVLTEYSDNIQWNKCRAVVGLKRSQLMSKDLDQDQTLKSGETLGIEVSKTLERELGEGVKFNCSGHFDVDKNKIKNGKPKNTKEKEKHMGEYVDIERLNEFRNKFVCDLLTLEKCTSGFNTFENIECGPLALNKFENKFSKLSVQESKIYNEMSNSLGLHKTINTNTDQNKWNRIVDEDINDLTDLCVDFWSKTAVELKQSQLSDMTARSKENWYNQQTCCIAHLKDCISWEFQNSKAIEPANSVNLFEKGLLVGAKLSTNKETLWTEKELLYNTFWDSNQFPAKSVKNIVSEVFQEIEKMQHSKENSASGVISLFSALSYPQIKIRKILSESSSCFPYFIKRKKDFYQNVLYYRLHEEKKNSKKQNRENIKISRVFDFKHFRIIDLLVFERFLHRFCYLSLAKESLEVIDRSFKIFIHPVDTISSRRTHCNADFKLSSECLKTKNLNIFQEPKIQSKTEHKSSTAAFNKSHCGTIPKTNNWKSTDISNYLMRNSKKPLKSVETEKTNLNKSKNKSKTDSCRWKPNLSIECADIFQDYASSKRNNKLFLYQDVDSANFRSSQLSDMEYFDIFQDVSNCKNSFRMIENLESTQDNFDIEYSNIFQEIDRWENTTQRRTSTKSILRSLENFKTKEVLRSSNIISRSALNAFHRKSLNKYDNIDTKYLTKAQKLASLSRKKITITSSDDFVDIDYLNHFLDDISNIGSRFSHKVLKIGTIDTFFNNGNRLNKFKTSYESSFSSLNTELFEEFQDLTTISPDGSRLLNMNELVQKHQLPVATNKSCIKSESSTKLPLIKISQFSAVCSRSVKEDKSLKKNNLIRRIRLLCVEIESLNSLTLNLPAVTLQLPTKGPTKSPIQITWNVLFKLKFPNAHQHLKKLPFLLQKSPMNLASLQFGLSEFYTQTFKPCSQLREEHSSNCTKLEMFTILMEQETITKRSHPLFTSESRIDRISKFWKPIPIPEEPEDEMIYNQHPNEEYEISEKSNKNQRAFRNAKDLALLKSIIGPPIEPKVFSYILLKGILKEVSNNLRTTNILPKIIQARLVHPFLRKLMDEHISCCSVIPKSLHFPLLIVLNCEMLELIRRIKSRRDNFLELSSSLTRMKL